MITISMKQQHTLAPPISPRVAEKVIHADSPLILSTLQTIVLLKTMITGTSRILSSPTDQLIRLVSTASLALRIGNATAFLLAFDQDADHDAGNFLWFRARHARFVYIDRVVVAGSERGRGHARRLYDAVFRQAADVGHDRGQPPSRRRSKPPRRRWPPPRAPLPLSGAEVIVARGPFDLAGDRAMLTAHRIEIVVARNAGGNAASAKIEAARDLGLPVVMVRRPFIPAREKVETIAEVLRWLGHDETPAERGV